MKIDSISRSHENGWRSIGLGVCFGMGGFLYFLEIMVLLLGQSLLPKVLVICWSILMFGLMVVSGVSSSGSGFYSHLPGQRWRSRGWGHLDDIGPAGGVVESCRGFCSVPGPLQTVQRAEFWGLFLPYRLPRLFTWELIT